MIELNKKYLTKDLAKELEVSYDHLRRYRNEYEEHLSKFYVYSKTMKGNAATYVFEQELYPFISYKEYKKEQKSATLQKHIKNAIQYDSRQTGANIARIIYINGEIKALDWKLSTLTVYTRDELKALVKAGYYQKEDYRWCYLNEAKGQYELMSDEDVSMLRYFFHTRENDEAEENIWARQEEGDLTLEEAEKEVGNLRKGAFIQGRQQYKEETGRWPIKVPVYVRTAF